MNDYLLPILIIVFIFAFVRIIATLAKSKGCGSDKKQNQPKGKAFKFGFISMLIIAIISAVISLLFNKDFITIAAALFIVIFIAVLAKKKSCSFDERQELIRGRAFKYAFFSILIYVIGYGAISLMLEKDFMTTSAALFTGVFISFVIFAVYNIWNESFFALKQAPINFILLFSSTAICSGYTGICSIKDGSIMENGLLNFECLSIVSSIAFVIVVITILIRLIINKKAEQEGE